jgi:hypothetical protein
MRNDPFPAFRASQDKEKTDEALFDYRKLEPEVRAFVKERETLIREMAKRTAQGIVLIGQWLTEVKEQLPHGEWLPWLKDEFGWSRMTAERFMQVHEKFKMHNLCNLEIDVSALYLIAAPSTPDIVVHEVIERAEKGEPMTRAKAEEILGDYRRRNELPSPGVARSIAVATGKHTAADNGYYIPPITRERQEELWQEATPIMAMLGHIADIERECRSLEPNQIIKWLSTQQVLYDFDEVTTEVLAAIQWLNHFLELSHVQSKGLGAPGSIFRRGPLPRYPPFPALSRLPVFFPREIDARTIPPLGSITRASIAK